MDSQEANNVIESARMESDPKFLCGSRCQFSKSTNTTSSSTVFRGNIHSILLVYLSDSIRNCSLQLPNRILSCWTFVKMRCRGPRVGSSRWPLATSTSCLAYFCRQLCLFFNGYDILASRRRHLSLLLVTLGRVVLYGGVTAA